MTENVKSIDTEIVTMKRDQRNLRMLGNYTMVTKIKDSVEGLEG